MHKKPNLQEMFEWREYKIWKREQLFKFIGTFSGITMNAINEIIKKHFNKVWNQYVYNPLSFN